VLAYLVGACLIQPQRQDFDIGGAEIFTYLEMMQKYAEVAVWQNASLSECGAHPLLSAYWVDLVTPISSGIAPSADRRSQE